MFTYFSGGLYKQDFLIGTFVIPNQKIINIVLNRLNHIEDEYNYELELKNDLYIQGAKVVNIKNSTWKMVKTESLNKKEIQTIIKNELH